MLIKSKPKDHGIFFAIWPRRVPDGLALFEFLHWRQRPGPLMGRARYEYTRLVPDELYDQGQRRKFAPPEPCSEPPPCDYPVCACMFTIDPAVLG